jgi:predicted transcriptional regulator
MPLPQPTERELDLLKILWEHQGASVREIYDILHASDTQLAYTTVLSLLQTMERKGLVQHEIAGKAYRYFASVQRDQTFRSLAGSFLDHVFDGAIGEYLVHAMESRQPTEKELSDMEAMIAQYRQRQQTRTKGK